MILILNIRKLITAGNALQQTFLRRSGRIRKSRLKELMKEFGKRNLKYNIQNQKGRVHGVSAKI